MKKANSLFIAIAATGLFFLFQGILFSQQTALIDSVLLSKINDEGLNRSKVMNTVSVLTEVCGSRLTNSPGYKRAADSVKSKLESYGVQNVHFDYWGEEFGRGWQLKNFSIHCIEPVYSSLTAYPKAWSPGIKGSVKAEVIYLDVKTKEDVIKYAGKLKGKIILFNSPVALKTTFEPEATRLNDSMLLELANAGMDEERTTGGRRLRSKELQEMVYLKWQLCEKEGAVAVLETSLGSSTYYGTLSVSSATIPSSPEIPFDKRIRAWDPKAPKFLPQVVVASDQYNNLVRQIQSGKKITIELSLDAEFTPAAEGFNVIGEIPGTDLKDEIVMIGAHLDSWHGATGATDNAAGSAVMIEVMRIITTLEIIPRRTIRIGLWDGEEQGLLGSKSYVKRNFGERLDKSAPYDSIQLKPGSEKFSVYFNMDNGTGKIRGIYLQGNEVSRPIFRKWFMPFEKTGVATITLKNTASTDHLSFNNIGLPGFQFIQDPIDYFNKTHHTNMDVYDKLLEDDLKQNAVIITVIALQAANRTEMFPRK